MSVAVVTGSCGLIGYESAAHFGAQGMTVAGVDNDMRASFFGPEAPTSAGRAWLQQALGDGYEHHDLDVRDRGAMLALFQRHGPAIYPGWSLAYDARAIAAELHERNRESWTP